MRIGSLDCAGWIILLPLQGFIALSVVHTDLYKLNLKSLKDGKHEFAYRLDDAYFANIGGEITSGEVEAKVECVRHAEVYQLTISLDGYVVTACDRCLDEVELDVVTERNLVVKLGAEYQEESDEIIIIPEREGVFDLQWLLYEDIILDLPLQRMHEDDDCNSSMMALYGGISIDEDQLIEREAGQGVERNEEAIDQRWAALKQLKINN